ncbi:MAG: glycerophosphodiester phosphodiesterase family protein [Acholeplasmataceae bacterium]
MKDMSWLKTEFIAHRGLHTSDGSVPENSRTAFIEAMNAGYAIECDLNVLGDGTVVVFHDNNMLRLCGKNIALNDITYEKMKEIFYLNTTESILTLKDLVELIDGKVPLLIELKPFGNIKQLCENTMALLKSYQGRYALFSFHPKIVYWLKKHHPSVIRGQISSFFKDENMRKFNKYLAKKMVFNRYTKPDFISYDIHDLPNKYADQAAKKGLPVLSFAAQTQQAFDRIKAHYDNVVFEYFIPK